MLFYAKFNSQNLFSESERMQINNINITIYTRWKVRVLIVNS